MIITTKLPAPELFVNRIMHWSKKLKPKKHDKQAGFFDTKLVIKATKPFKDTDLLSIQSTFFFADKRHRDIDNCIGACKALQDGIFLALGIDDHQIKMVKETKILYDKENPRTEIELNII